MNEVLSQYGFIGVFGLLVFAHYWWNNRKRGPENTSLRTSYRRVLWHFMKWFGTLYAAGASLMTIFVVSDLVGFSNFGYPFWALPVVILMVAIGCGIRAVFKNWLENER